MQRFEDGGKESSVVLLRWIGSRPTIMPDGPIKSGSVPGGSVLWWTPGYSAASAVCKYSDNFVMVFGLARFEVMFTKASA